MSNKLTEAKKEIRKVEELVKSFGELMVLARKSLSVVTLYFFYSILQAALSTTLPLIEMSEDSKEILNRLAKDHVAESLRHTVVGVLRERSEGDKIIRVPWGKPKEE